MTRKQRLAKALATKLNSLDPAVREQVLANVQMYRELKDELVGQVGIDEDLLAESFGQMSGLSQQISMAQSRAQTAGAIAGLGSQVFSAAGGFGAFSNPGQTDTTDLLKGIS